MAVTSELPGSGGPEATGGLFVRKSSGLVREVGIRDSVGISLGILLLLGVYSVPAVFLGAFPNGDLYIPILVGAVISLALAFAYAQLVGTFPRAGGEYIYTSRIVGPVIGAVVGGSLLVAGCLNDGSSIVSIDQIYVPFFFTTLGSALHIHALVTFGNSTLVHKTGFLIVGLVLVLLYAAICMRPIRTIAKWIFWSFALGMVVHFFIAFALLFETRGGFVHAFNAASGGNAYSAIISQAKAVGYSPGVSVSNVVALIPLGALIFLGFTYGNYAAGEIKRPLNTYKITVLTAIGVGLVSTMLGWAGMRHAAGLTFIQASASLSAHNPAAYSKLTPIVQTQGGLAYATLAASDSFSKILIAFGVMAAWFCNGLAYFALLTRVVFGLSFDRLLPTKMSEVRERSHAPVYAVGLVTFGVGAFTVFGNESTLLSVFRNLILVSYAVLVVGSLCAAALPYMRRDLYEASPKVFQKAIFGVPLITVVAAISALCFTGLDVDLASRTAYSGGFSTGSIITLAVVVFAGIPIYLASRFGLARRGIDVRMAMRELPPE